MAIESILRILGFSDQEPREMGELFKQLRGLLKQHSEEDLKYITGFAGLLGRVAYSDRDISAVELEHIEVLLKEHCTLPPVSVKPLVTLIRAVIFLASPYH